MLAGSWELGTIGKYQNRMPKAGSKAFNIREVWNQYVAMAPKLVYSYCGVHVVESSISHTNWLRYHFSSQLIKIWLSL